MPRCPDCNKFVSLDTDEEPEVEHLDTDDDGNVTATARIVNKCGECGTELREGTVELESDCTEEVITHLKDAGIDTEVEGFDVGKVEGHQLEVEEGDLGRDQEGGGRYAKSYYVALVGFTLKCSCGWEHEGELTGKIAASHMDEMV